MSHLFEKINSGGVYTIVEMSANHGGKLENAFEIVHKAKEIGADCLKIQTYTADTITIDCDKPDFIIHGGLWDGYKLHDLYIDAGTPYEWQKAIKEECDKVGIDFLSSPFDFSAVDFLESIGTSAYKIASYELVDIPLIEYAAKCHKPIIISCGMGTVEEIQDAVDACHRVGNNQVVLLKCCSEYPANWADMHLANIPDMQKRFGVPIGFSDHSFGTLASVVAVSMGACIVEKHMKLPGVDSPDAGFSMLPEDFATLIRNINDAVTIRGGVHYGCNGAERNTLRRSLYAVKDIRAGEVFSAENVRSIRPSPAHALKPKYYSQLLGTTANRDISFGTPITEEDLSVKNDTVLRLDLATDDDCQLLFRWANDPDTRKNSIHPEPIKWETHCSWFCEKMANDKSIIYILRDSKGIAIGQIRGDETAPNTAEISYSIDPAFRGHGYGTTLLKLFRAKTLKETNWNQLIGVVKKDNKWSQRAFEKAGYEKEEQSGFYKYSLIGIVPNI